jgi:hypothetical protein
VEDGEGPLWVRIGGGLEEIPGGAYHGPADPEFPPPGGPWVPLQVSGCLVGWGRPGILLRKAARRAQEEGQRLRQERQAYLTRRLAHKLRSAVLGLRESARLASFGRPELLKLLYEQAQDVAQRAQALETVVLGSMDTPRAVVLGAVLNLAVPGIACSLPDEAVVCAPEPALVEVLSRTYEWMGGPGSRMRARRVGRWWCIDVEASPQRRALAVPELGEPLIRYLVDVVLGGWLSTGAANGVRIYLPAA